MASFQQRLTTLKEAAGFTYIDLAVWCGGISWQAIWSWIRGSRLPKDYRQRRVDKSLDYLERELAKAKSALPIPLSLKEGERRAYVDRVRQKYPPC